MDELIEILEQMGATDIVIRRDSLKDMTGVSWNFNGATVHLDSIWCTDGTSSMEAEVIDDSDV